METSESGAGANHDKQPQSNRSEVRRNSEDDNGDTKQRAMETRNVSPKLNVRAQGATPQVEF